MIRAIALFSVFAAGAATAQPVVVAPASASPAAALAAATAVNACGAGVLLSARYSGPNQVTAVCRPPVGLQFGGLSGGAAAAAAGAAALLAVVIAVSGDDDDNGSTNGTNGTN